MGMKVHPATYLERKRRDCGITQQQLADKLAVTLSKIHRFERGLTIPNIVEGFNYARILGVNSNEFLEAVYIMFNDLGKR